VGIIANPASGKDIRRLVAHATTVDNQGKVGILRRILLGLGAAGVSQVAIMPDAYALGRRALEGLARGDGCQSLPAVRMLDMPVTGRGEDSELAARLLRQAGARCIVVLGGDGTARVVSKEAGAVPLLLVSTGTNNVLPSFIDGTIVGLAAGAVARGLVNLEAVSLRHKWLELTVDGVPRDRALVDVAALKGRFVGTRAVWGVSGLQQLVVTRGDCASTGMSAIAGVVRPTTAEEPAGVALWFSPTGRRFLAPIAPGLISEVRVGPVRVLGIEDSVDLVATRPLVVALDGERQVALYEGTSASVRLRGDGPLILDTRRVMREAVVAKLLER